jgi:chromosome segregation ATPase
MLMITRSMISLSVVLSVFVLPQTPGLAQNSKASLQVKDQLQSKTSSVSNESLQKAATRDAVEDAVAKIDGVPVRKPEKTGFTISDLNPFKYIFKPITDVRKEVKNLGQQVNDFNTPLTTMQKPMVGLRQDLVEVQGKMQTLHGDIDGVHRGMQHIERHIDRIDTSLGRIAVPVGELAKPVMALQKPVKAVDGQLKALKSDLHEMKDTVTFTTSAIFIAILGLGALVVFGTPVAGLYVLRHKTAIMNKLGQKGPVKEESKAEEVKIS